MHNFLPFALNRFLKAYSKICQSLFYQRLIPSHLHLASWMHSDQFITMLKYQVYFALLNWYFDLKDFVDYCEILSSAVEIVAEHI